jgi:very-short-patch-repair endonuclease
MYCLECDSPITKEVYNYSTSNIGVPLCRHHQNWVKRQLVNRSTTNEALSLYFALRYRGVPAELEKDDGYKHVDISIEEANVHIEVDGGHHNYDSHQALSDLKRTYHSFKKRYFTIRIPNSLVHHCLDETADTLVDVLELGRKKAATKGFSFFGLFK